MRKLEEQLLMGVLSGDKSSFDILFRNYYNALVVIACDILQDACLAEEAVQDVFMKIWKTRAELSINTSLGAYLVRMVRNRSIDYIRTRARQIKTVSIDHLETQAKLHEIGMDSTFDDDLFDGPLEIALKQGIEQLPPQCKQIFILNRFEGYTPIEISEQLQVSLSTVKTQISRALLKMNEIILRLKNN